ncbi:MAG: alpha/beta hydrolase [Deltaproteobacteria bacterium]|jgi:pimeloyl-ACP methyl ester carboxylesterase|nr:alpha/beta hydrolase [Deltaproteobacteria bacterium]MBT6488615.1 alpha/beta hydrolase [Deltaproteobacteria bacterium]
MMQTNVLHTSRGDFAYLADGPEDGPVVLCLHGFPDHAPSWNQLLGHLASQGYRAIAPWLRGYAPSVLDGDFDIDSLTDDIIELSAEFGSQDTPIRLVGHDWGAVLTWLAAAHHPKRFISAATLAVPHPLKFFELLVRNPSQLGRSGYMGLFQLRTLSDWVVTRGDLSFIDLLWKKWSPGYEPCPQQMTELKTCLRTSMPGPLNYYRKILRPLVPSIRRLLDPSRPERSIQIPILSITGVNDGCIAANSKLDSSQFMMAPYKHMEVPNAGHFMHLEAPGVVNSAITSWFLEH